jgi:hypothetical protein
MNILTLYLCLGVLLGRYYTLDLHTSFSINYLYLHITAIDL